MILFLDDSPERAAIAYQRMSEKDRDKVIWCKTVEETIITLRDYKDVLELVTLDHDLGGETFVNTKREDCGMEIVRWFEHLPSKEIEKFLHIRFVIHSWNISAGLKMTERLLKLGLNVIQNPFGS